MPGMEQRLNYAAQKDVQIRFREEEYVSGMGQKRNVAAKKDVQSRLRWEECVSNTEERDYAATKDARNRLRQEECASGMVERHYVATQDVQIKLRKEECVKGMGLIAIQMMNLLHSGDQNSNRQLLINLNPLSMSLGLPSQDKAFPTRWPSSV